MRTRGGGLEAGGSADASAEAEGRSSARRNANSAAESIGTSSKSRLAGRRKPQAGSCASALVAASNSVARSVAPALANCRSKRSSRTARSAPPSGKPLRRSACTPARRSSCSVRASARGKPGVLATGAKYCSASSRRASKVARAATASEPREVTGASPCAASTGAASRAASCARLKRWTPMVAPRAAAIDRPRSSAAPREAPTSHTSPRDACVSTNARASWSRSCAEGDSIRRIIGHSFSHGHHAGSSDSSRATRPRNGVYASQVQTADCRLQTADCQLRTRVGTGSGASPRRPALSRRGAASTGRAGVGARAGRHRLDRSR